MRPSPKFPTFNSQGQTISTPLSTNLKWDSQDTSQASALCNLLKVRPIFTLNIFSLSTAKATQTQRLISPTKTGACLRYVGASTRIHRCTQRSLKSVLAHSCWGLRELGDLRPKTELGCSLQRKSAREWKQICRSQVKFVRPRWKNLGPSWKRHWCWITRLYYEWQWFVAKRLDGKSLRKNGSLKALLLNRCNGDAFKVFWNERAIKLGGHHLKTD